MIKLMNDSLISTITEKKDGKDGRPDFYRMIISSSIATPDKKKDGEKSKRVIEHVLFTQEDNFNKENTRILVDWKTGRPFVKIHQGERNQYDTPVYIIAIPYNGFIIPVEKSPMYRIYKAINVKADRRNIEFEDKKYNQVMYLTVVPNTKMMTDEKSVLLTVDCYSKDKDDTIKTTWTITFNSDMDKTFIEQTSEITDPIDQTQYKGIKTFQIFTGPKPKKDDEDADKSSEKSSSNRDSKGPRKAYNENSIKGIESVVESPGLGTSIGSLLQNESGSKNNKHDRKNKFNKKNKKNKRK